MSYRSYTEYLSHPRFRQSCEAVKARSRGKCESPGCGRDAMDFHHVRYCPWGEFDPPGNLVHLCRNCHEEAHRCERCGSMTKADAIKLGVKLCKRCREAVR